MSLANSAGNGEAQPLIQDDNPFSAMTTEGFQVVGSEGGSCMGAPVALGPSTIFARTANGSPNFGN